MADRTNRRILLAARPRGEVTADCLRLVEEPAPDVGEGQALVRNLYLSLDPTIRGWMNEGEGYMPPIGIGEVVRSSAVGRVVESHSPAYAVGDLVLGVFGWQDYAVVDSGLRGGQVLPKGTSPTDALSIFGITGMTAYFGITDVAQPDPGETVLVSGAAGATGSVAGQVARILGCRVVGTAGTDEKCAWVTGELGFDACINYRKEELGPALDRTCPDGIDVYFDNVGGELLERVLDRINLGARIALCGGISGYNLTELPPGPRNLMSLVIKRARMEGFLVLDYFSRFPEGQAKLAEWVAAGKLHNRVDVAGGLENTPAAFQKLFTGGNTGKLLVKVAD